MSNEGFLLFCFPFAGGTIDFYNNLERVCNKKVKLIKLEYSGHGTRMKSPLYRDFNDLTNDLYPQVISVLNDYPDMDYSLLGYSMGSIAVFDMLQKMQENHIAREPWGVFLSAHLPQPIKALHVIPSNEIDEWVKKRTIEFGGLDKEMIENRIFWRVYLPIFKADYLMISNYDFDSLTYTTNIPATIFYSEEDTPYSEMKGWKKYFRGECDFVEYSGSHFFIENYYKEMSSVIIEKYRDYMCKKGRR